MVVSALFMSARPVGASETADSVTEWEYLTIESALTGGHSIEYIGNTVHLSYYRFNPSNCVVKVIYATYYGTSTTYQVVDQWNNCSWKLYQSEGIIGSSLEIDSTGRPHIAYTYRTNQTGDTPHLRYAYKNLSNVWVRVLDFGDNIENEAIIQPVLALDSNNSPRIAYVDHHNTPEVNYIYNNGAGWFREVIDATSISPQHARVSMEYTSGIPRLSYYAARDSSADTIVFAERDSNGTWKSDKAAVSVRFYSQFIKQSSVVTLSDGRPSIAYISVHGSCLIGQVFYAIRNVSGEWESQNQSSHCPASYNGVSATRFNNKTLFAYPSASLPSEPARPMMMVYEEGQYTVPEAIDANFGVRPEIKVNSSGNMAVAYQSTSGLPDNMGPLKLAISQ